MIGVDQKLSTFNEVSKVFDRQVDGQEFPIKRAVSGLCRLELLGKVGDWTPLISNILLQCYSYSRIRGIAHNGCWSISLKLG